MKSSLLTTLGVGALVMLAMPDAVSSAHPGRTAADGCHNDRRNGGRHCHGAGSGGSRQPAAALRSRGSGGAFANCSAARAAGAAPVRRGQPGYGTHLDRDDDGVGCE
jgi:hypothetical protein